MKKKTVSGMLLTLLLIGMLALAFDIQPVRASGTIYIRADGSIDPPTANITTVDNVTYTFIDNIYDSIVVERDNIVIDGVGYTLIAPDPEVDGITVKGDNVTINDVGIKESRFGIYLLSSNNIIVGNYIRNCSRGIFTDVSHSNIIFGNSIADNSEGGVTLRYSSSNNSIVENNITENRFGINLEGSSWRHSSNNSVVGNNITNSGHTDIRLYCFSNGRVLGNNITNSKGVGGWGISITGSNNSISGNNITTIGRGISLSYTYSSNNTVSGNIITAKDCTIYLFYASNSSVVENNIAKGGIWLDYSSNNCIIGNAITKCMTYTAISVARDSHNNSISENIISDSSAYGIGVVSSSNNSISENAIIDCTRGIELSSSSDNTVTGNDVTTNDIGVWLYKSFNNSIHHNNFVFNFQQVYDRSWDSPTINNSVNFWDDGYPSGGNYWSDYDGFDLYSGPYQNETGSDGIGDTPYVIDAVNQDRYPRVGLALSILLIRPNRGGNTGSVTVKIWGSGFQPEVKVRLTRQGYTDIEGINIQVPNPGLIITTFNFTGREPGLWDVVVTLPDATEARLPEAFTIVLGGQPKLWVELVGRSRIRFGQNATFWITYGNNGETDTYDVNLVIRIPTELKFKVNISPPNVSGVDWEQVPLGSIVGSHRIISIWIYDVPAFSTGLLSLTVQAPFTPGELNIATELWQSQPNKFTQTGDFAFANESSIFSRLENTYPILLAANFTTMPTTDFANGLLTWLQANQNEIRLIPYAFLSVAAATEVLGMPISDTAIKLLVDPFGSTGSPGPCYGNYCGPGWNDINNNGIMDEPALDDLDAACRDHDIAYEKLGIGGASDVWNRVGGPPQDEADWELIENALVFNPSTSYWTETLGLIPGTIAANKFRNALVVVFTAMYLKPHPENKDYAESEAEIAGSWDPNEKAGPSGFGSQRFIASDRELPYIIFFENLENATAPAEDIVITDQLDLDLDWSTLKFGEMSHPQNATTNFNSETGTITWTFKGINLPPNKNPPEGEGWVMFTIKPKPNLPSGTEIRNKATIVFDFNPPIDTPEFLNTIDLQPPSSRVDELPSQQPLSFEVSWAGTDDAAGSGIRDYTIYVSDNNGPYTRWLQTTCACARVSATFTGEKGHTYAFYSIARDKVGNTEQPPTQPDTTVTMDPTPPTTSYDYDGLWHTADFTITLTATDVLSDIAEIYYKINDGPTLNVTANGQPLITTESADNKLEYWSADTAGNEEIPHKTLTGIKLDKTAPMANAGQDQTVNVGKAVTFDASGSTDDLSGVFSYEWDFGDGATETGITCSHTYAKPDTYTVTLTVKDTAGNSKTDSIAITVTSEGFPLWILGAVAGIAVIGIAMGIFFLRRRRPTKD